MTYRRWKAHGPDAGLKVFLHGLGADGEFDNHALFDLWLKSGYHVIAIDLPGHGPGQSRFTPDTALEQVAAAWDEIRSREGGGGRPLHFVGESLGACFALSLAEREPSARLDLLNPPLGLRVSLPLLALEALQLGSVQIWRGLPFQTVWESLPAFGPFRRAHFPLRLASPGSKGHLPLISGFVQDMGLERRLEHFPRPAQVRVFQARWDAVVATTRVEGVHARLPRAARFELRILPGTHLSLKDAYRRKWACGEWPV